MDYTPDRSDHSTYGHQLRYVITGGRPDMMDPLGQLASAEARCWRCPTTLLAGGVILNEDDALDLIDRQGWTTLEQTIHYVCEPGEGPDGTTPLIEDQIVHRLLCYGCREATP